MSSETKQTSKIEAVLSRLKDCISSNEPRVRGLADVEKAGTLNSRDQTILHPIVPLRCDFWINAKGLILTIEV
jgi:hypothetical protein